LTCKWRALEYSIVPPQPQYNGVIKRESGNGEGIDNLWPHLQKKQGKCGGESYNNDMNRT